MGRSFPGEMQLLIPAQEEYALAAALAVNGLGVKAGLDLDLLGDLRTVTTECIDCLANQPRVPEEIRLTASLREGMLSLRFEALSRGETLSNPPSDPVLTRSVLETLMPVVSLEEDQGGIHTLCCAMRCFAND